MHIKVVLGKSRSVEELVTVACDGINDYLEMHSCPRVEPSKLFMDVLLEYLNPYISENITLEKSADHLFHLVVQVNKVPAVDTDAFESVNEALGLGLMNGVGSDLREVFYSNYRGFWDYLNRNTNHIEVFLYNGHNHRFRLPVVYRKADLNDNSANLYMRASGILMTLNMALGLAVLRADLTGIVRDLLAIAIPNTGSGLASIFYSRFKIAHEYGDVAFRPQTQAIDRESASSLFGEDFVGMLESGEFTQIEVNMNLSNHQMITTSLYKAGDEPSGREFTYMISYSRLTQK